jgi:hypothetical protein
MRAEQTVTEMAEEVLSRQAGDHAQSESDPDNRSLRL